MDIPKECNRAQAGYAAVLFSPLVRPHRLTARTRLFQGRSTGSIPVGATTTSLPVTRLQQLKGEERVRFTHVGRRLRNQPTLNPVCSHTLPFTKSTVARSLKALRRSGPARAGPMRGAR